MRSTLLLVLLLLASSCTSSASGDGGLPPTGCSVTASGSETGTFTCSAGLFASSPMDMLRVMNLADPTSQPLSVQIVCSAPHPFATGTYVLPPAGGGSGCGIVVQQFTPDLGVARLWQAQPGRGDVSVVVTDTNTSTAPFSAHGHGHATAVETDTSTGTPIAGSDVVLDFTF